MVAKGEHGALVVVEVHEAGAADPDLLRRTLVGTRLAAGPESAEAEAVRRKRAVIVDPGRALAPVVVDSRALGTLVGEASDYGLLTGARRDALAVLAAAFGQAAARAAVIDRLHLQLQQVTELTVSARTVLTELAGLPLDPFSTEDTRRSLNGTVPITASPAAPARAELSARERDVMELLATGATNPMIAERLCVSRDTVKTHVSRIFRKLGAANRADAVSRYLRAH